MRLIHLLVCCLVFPTLQACSQERNWDLIGKGYQLTADSAVDGSGNVFFTDARTNRILKVDGDGHISVWLENSGGAHGVAFGPDGRLYAGQHDRTRIVTLSSDGRESIVAEGVQTHHLIVTKRNEVYFSLAPLHEVGMVDAMGKFRIVTNQVEWPHGLHLLDNPPRMIVTDSKNGEVWAFRIQPDGTLADKAPSCRLEPHGKGSEIEAGGVTSDTTGDIYIATKFGIQICDAAGNTRETIPAPDNEGVSNLLFAGADFRWMYATNGDALYRRHLKRNGVQR